MSEYRFTASTHQVYGCNSCPYFKPGRDDPDNIGPGNGPTHQCQRVWRFFSQGEIRPHSPDWCPLVGEEVLLCAGNEPGAYQWRENLDSEIKRLRSLGIEAQRIGGLLSIDPEDLRELIRRART